MRISANFSCGGTEASRALVVGMAGVKFSARLFIQRPVSRRLNRPMSRLKSGSSDRAGWSILERSSFCFGDVENLDTAQCLLD